MLAPRSAVPFLPALVLIAAGALAACRCSASSIWRCSGRLARQLLALLTVRRTTNVPALLAVRHVHGAPTEAATALCGIVASTALVIAMATIVTSFPLSFSRGQDGRQEVSGKGADQK